MQEKGDNSLSSNAQYLAHLAFKIDLQVRRQEFEVTERAKYFILFQRVVRTLLIELRTVLKLFSYSNYLEY